MPSLISAQLYITSKNSEAFHVKFATLRTLAKVNATTWQQLSGKLRTKGVAPFLPEGADYGNIYLQTKAEAALK